MKYVICLIRMFNPIKCGFFIFIKFEISNKQKEKLILCQIAK